MQLHPTHYLVKLRSTAPLLGYLSRHGRQEHTLPTITISQPTEYWHEGKACQGLWRQDSRGLGLRNTKLTLNGW